MAVLKTEGRGKGLEMLKLAGTMVPLARGVAEEMVRS